MSGFERKAPNQINYNDVLPLAIPSSSNRRKFYPNNGQEFSPDGTNIIRIDVNADSMLDVGHSYLEMEVVQTTANNRLAMDMGCPMIQRLRIESGGITLEDINEYGRLYAMLEDAQFAPNNYRNEYSVLLGQSDSITKATAGGALANSENVVDAPRYCSLSALHSDNAITTANPRRVAIPLVSALLNCDKYIPLVMCNAGFTIEITLAPAKAIGIQQDATPANVKPTWKLKNVSYDAHLVDLDRSFYDALRAEMAMTGSIALNGQTWRHYGSNIATGSGSANVNIPCRQKSIKSIFSTFRDAKYSIDLLANYGFYSTSVLQRQNISQWGYRVGSVAYPQARIDCSTKDQLAPTLAEVLKAFGKLGDISTNTCFSKSTFSANLDGDAGNAGLPDGQPISGQIIKNFCVGYDCEGFSKTALESGINTAERALPITLDLDFVAPTANDVVNDNYVCSDIFFYVNADGTITPSS